MLSCTCRPKNRISKAKNGKRHTPLPFSLVGSNLQETFSALLSRSLPAGLVMPGYSYSAIRLWELNGAKITLVPSTNPDPLLPSGVQYRTPSEIWGSTAQLFVKGQNDITSTDFSDLNQGSLGDCWMVAAIAALANYGKLADGKTVIEQAFASVTPAGAVNPSSVAINLYAPSGDSGRTSEATKFVQTISTKIPVLTTNLASPAYTYSDEPGEYWPCMMEKAVAAALRRTTGTNVVVGYPAMLGGHPAVGMSFFTPGIAAYYYWDNAPPPTGDQLYAGWNGAMASGITIAVVFQNTVAAQSSGLVGDHAYSIYSIIVAAGVKLALVRNPWGIYGLKGEWTGAWSDNSPLWNSNPTVKAACGFQGPRGDGLFWMSFDDLARYLSYYEIFIPDRSDMRAKDLRTTPFLTRSGCQKILNTNFYGADLAVIKTDSADTCCSYCSVNPSCKAWSWVSPSYANSTYWNTCYLKNAVPQGITSAGITSGLNSGCIQFADTDYPGSDIKQIKTDSAGQCCANCSTTVGCKAWTWVGPSYPNSAILNTCFLKNAVPQAVSSNGLISGKIPGN